MDLSQLTIAGLREQFRSGAASPEDAVRAVEQAIKTRDGSVGGYLSADIETALAEARSADLDLPLGGVPIAVKDVISVKGQPCSCASKILHERYRAPYDATVIAKLRAAGAIPLGRTNMDEFAMGSSTENSGLQPTRNPWNLERAPGGSSGGSAAVVAADSAIAALGSDTGGSIRQPASFCGCVGVKPTYGRVSRYGLVAFASSLDQIGPMTKSVEDSALLMNVISGRDPSDSTSLDEAVPDYTASLGKGVKGLKIGLPREMLDSTPMQEGIKDTVLKALEVLEEAGAEIVEVQLPGNDAAVAVYYILATAEASANLARFDGVRYGYRAEGVENLEEHYKRSRSEGFGEEVKRRIILGTYVLSSGYADQYYTRAQQVRSVIRKEFERAFEKVDVIATPTCPSVAFELGEKTDNPLEMYLSDIFTIASNLCGSCGVSVPCGFLDGLPVGLQILGPAFAEERVFQMAHAYEQATEWSRKRPELA